MQKPILLIILVLCCSACNFFPGVYKIDIDQGNIVTQKMVDQLRPGMTKEQVTFVMGTPMITDPFQQERWDYLLTEQHDDKEYFEQRISLFFKDDKLMSFTGDFRPSPPTTKSETPIQ